MGDTRDVQLLARSFLTPSSPDLASRAAALTRRLLAFSRAEALLPEAIDAGALIAGMTELLERTIGDAITVETRTGDTDWRIWADRHQLWNALITIAVHLSDAMERRGPQTHAIDGPAAAAEATHRAAS